MCDAAGGEGRQVGNGRRWLSALETKVSTAFCVSGEGSSVLCCSP